MNELFLVGAGVWTLLLAIWAYRVSFSGVYAEKLWVSLWVATRLLLRFLLGVGLLWALRAAWEPNTSHYRMLIVEASLPEAWAKADSLLRQRHARVRTGLLAVKGRSVFWVLPPTSDIALFRWVQEARPKNLVSTSQEDASESPRYWTALSAYRPFVRQVVWIGRRPPRQPTEDFVLLACGPIDKTHSSAAYPVVSSAAAVPPPSIPLSESDQALLLAGGGALLLLLGDALMPYLFRHNLPLQ